MRDTVTAVLLLDTPGDPPIRWVCVDRRMHYALEGDPPDRVRSTWPCNPGLHEGTKVFPGSANRSFELGPIEVPAALLTGTT